jgi:ABC-type branched-subunit amino acid transport system ATPase component
MVRQVRKKSTPNALPRLGERINQTAGTLSGGEQQMLALADYVYLTDVGAAH